MGVNETTNPRNEKKQNNNERKEKRT
jgi:hypothetical protein